MKYTEKVIQIMKSRCEYLQVLKKEKEKLDSLLSAERIGAADHHDKIQAMQKEYDDTFMETRNQLYELIPNYNNAVDDSLDLNGTMLNDDVRILSTPNLELTKHQLQAIADRNHDNPLVCQMLRTRIDEETRKGKDVYIDGLPASKEVKKQMFLNFVNLSANAAKDCSGISAAMIMENRCTPKECTEVAN